MVGDIVDAHRINTHYLGDAQNAILDFLLKTSDRGLQLVFRDGSRLGLIRADMSGIDEFLQALTERMTLERQDLSTK
jgi:UDP-2,3-diacylglucosamine pyrophosphatase LpxH